MLLMDEPLQPDVRTGFVEDQRAVRGKSAVATGAWVPQSWIDLSPVTAVALTAKATDDPELVNFITAEQGRFRYDYVRLRCSFRPANGERFDKGWLEVSLAPTGAGVADPPVAWSIQPGSASDPVEVTNSAKIGAKFKLLTAEASQTAKGTMKLYSIRGYREGGPQPFWEMQHTDLADLDGSMAFHLVVRSPASVETTGSVKLSTVIGERKFWVFHSERPHPEEPVQKFVLPAVPVPLKGGRG